MLTTGLPEQNYDYVEVDDYSISYEILKANKFLKTVILMNWMELKYSVLRVSPKTNNYILSHKPVPKALINVN